VLEKKSVGTLDAENKFSESESKQISTSCGHNFVYKDYNIILRGENWKPNQNSNEKRFQEKWKRSKVFTKQ
jgi:hypothetical protein